MPFMSVNDIPEWTGVRSPIDRPDQRFPTEEEAENGLGSEYVALRRRKIRILGPVGRTIRRDLVRTLDG